jgi:predicted  nucleic acid-binding Zn-ribbon protein
VELTPEVFIPIVVAIVAPIGAYLLAARKMSGKVTTSDASQLWAESRDIRDDYRVRLGSANDRIIGLEGRVTKCEETNLSLEKENLFLQRKIQELEELIVELRATIVKLEGTVADKEAKLRERA